MKIGFQNIDLLTESRFNYLITNLLKMGLEIYPFDNNKISLFDYLDIFNPEYFLAYPSIFTNDLVNYFNQNHTNTTKFIISISDFNYHKQFDELVKKNKLPIEALIVDNKQDIHKNNKYKYIYMPNCFDNNINEQIKIYDIDYGIIICNQSEKKKYEGSYHFICGHPKASQCSDINFKYLDIAYLINNYKTVIFRSFDNNILSQLFFDAIIKCEKVYYDIDNEDDALVIQTAINNLFNKEFILDFNNENKLQDFSELKSILRKKHSSINRTKTFISQLKENYELINIFNEVFGA